MKIASTKTKRIIQSFPAGCLSMIIAISTSLVARPAEALELGELTAQPPLVWLAGSLVAIAIGIVMVRRRLAGKSGTGPATPIKTEHPQHPSGNTQPTLENSSETSEVDYDISDDAPTVNSLTLDADHIMGTSLIDDPESAAPSELEREVQPVDRDMSVIMDATKLRRSDDVAIRDFETAEVTNADETIMTRTIDLEEAAAKYALEQNHEDDEDAIRKPDESV